MQQLETRFARIIMYAAARESMYSYIYILSMYFRCCCSVVCCCTAVVAAAAAVRHHRVTDAEILAAVHCI